MTQHINFEGYASIFDKIDRDTDIIAQGAFSNTLRDIGNKELTVPFIFEHDSTEVIGTIDRLVERKKGLFVKGKFFLETARGQEAFFSLEKGFRKGLSIGYRANKIEFCEKRIRTIFSLSLYEISLVAMSSNDECKITKYKKVE